MSLSEYILSQPFYKDVDVVKKYKKYPEFQKQINKIEKQYLHDLNMSLYSNLTHLEKTSILQFYDAKTEKDHPKFYLNFYAFEIKFDQDEEEKFYLFFIRMLDQKLRENKKCKYSIIYYHCLTQSTFPFAFLNETFKKLPIFYYAMLDKIYVVEPNFLVKNAVGMFDFGRLHKMFSKRISYIDNLYELAKVQEISKSKVLQSLPDILKQQKHLKQQKKSFKQGALQNIQNNNHNKLQLTPQNGPIVLKSVQKQDYLTIPLQNHVRLIFMQQLNSEGMPIALLILFQTLKNKPQFLSLQGIFRKSGSIQQEQQIITQLSKILTVSPLQNIDEHSGYAVAGVVKKFFTKLTVPIIPYEIYNEIMNVTSIQQGKQVQFVRIILSKLPNLNRIILVNLIIFLKDQVISRKQQNKMNNYNMSVCFCPCIFRARQATLQDLMNSGKYAKILDILFSKFQQIIPKEEIKYFTGKQNRGSKSSKGSRESKQNRASNNQDSPTRVFF